MKKLRVLRNCGEEWWSQMPNLVTLFKYEMASTTREELVNMCQNLIDSGRLMDFHHPLRRTCFDLVVTGEVGNLQVPERYIQNANERTTDLDTTVH